MIRLDVFGWYEGSNTEAEHDPGLDTICIICGRKLSPIIRTISVMRPGDTKSYFYRVHKTCHESLSEEEMTEYDSSLIDNL